LLGSSKQYTIPLKNSGPLHIEVCTFPNFLNFVLGYETNIAEIRAQRQFHIKLSLKLGVS